ncbi:hypothetical protein GCM10025857_28800 [Alicyclobacillus contaminans]|uniref:GNAT family N-acetyltransferase n=1 Tax=Alicyclobacillus contaminans TaxID=392016 RepID=UPI000402C629|nr:GNAT family N-acetyltransferase [Alicyclobacillus contaminans]GMA51523.1 hypothetical protein GCM10025857_28800 [Alicyclobacillus contaminans]
MDVRLAILSERWMQQLIREDEETLRHLILDGGWQEFIARQSFAESIQEGFARAFFREQFLVGFGTAHLVPELYLPDGVRAAECGTYLRPAFRGKHCNIPCKEALLREVERCLPVDWCFFLVAHDNFRAQRAMVKLPWPIHVYPPDAPGPFARYQRRKSWELGVPQILYALEPSSLHPN